MAILVLISKTIVPFLLHYNRSLGTGCRSGNRRGEAGRAEVLMLARTAQAESRRIPRHAGQRGAYSKSDTVLENSPICCGVLQALG